MTYYIFLRRCLQPTKYSGVALCRCFPPTVHCSWSCARHAVFAHRAGLTLQNLMTQGGVVREHKTGVLQDNKQEYRDESSWSRRCFE